MTEVTEVKASGCQRVSHTQDAPYTKALTNRTPWQTEEEAQEEEDEQIAQHQQMFNEVDSQLPDGLLAAARTSPPPPTRQAPIGCVTPYPLGFAQVLNAKEEAQGKEVERQWTQQLFAPRGIEMREESVPCFAAVGDVRRDAHNMRSDNDGISGGSRIGSGSRSSEAANVVETRAALVQRVKTFQRQDKQNHWAGFCARQAFSSTDPAWMSNETLKSFLRERQPQATASISQRITLMDDHGLGTERPRLNEAIGPPMGRHQWQQSGSIWRPKSYHQSPNRKSYPSSPPWWLSSEREPNTALEVGNEWEHRDQWKQPSAGYANKQQGRHHPWKLKTGKTPW
jgi:hypothetical protein